MAMYVCGQAIAPMLLSWARARRPTYLNIERGWRVAAVTEVLCRLKLLTCACTVLLRWACNATWFQRETPTNVAGTECCVASMRPGTVLPQ